MKTQIQGNNYNYEILSNNNTETNCFCIRAICKSNGRFSCINNLNTVLSELNVDYEDPKYVDSFWIIPEDEAKRFNEMSYQFLTDPGFVEYLEKRLDEDRMCGEWEDQIDDLNKASI